MTSEVKNNNNNFLDRLAPRLLLEQTSPASISSFSPPRTSPCEEAKAGKGTVAMPKKGLAKSFLATISLCSTAASRRVVTPSSSQTSPSLSTQLLSSLDPTVREGKSKSPPSSSSPVNAAAVSREISVLLPDGENAVESTLVNNLLGIEWDHNPSPVLNVHRKVMTRERMKRYIFRNTESGRYKKLMKISAKRLGSGPTLEFFNKLGRGSSPKECNALIGVCISEARMSRDPNEAFECIGEACKLLLLMKEKGFEIEEASYGPILSYLVDFKMVEEFDQVCGFLKEENPRALSRLGYYEMLSCIRVSDEQRIKELCESVGKASDDDIYSVAENFFLAFCETDRVKELTELLNVLKINKVSKPCYVVTIFKSLGRLQLEEFALVFLSDISKAGVKSEMFSALIYEYTTNLPIIQAKEMVLKFVSLHEKLEAIPDLLYYDKLITYFCNLNLIAEALVIVDYMCKSGLNVTIGAFDPILLSCDQNSELHMVRSIYSLMCEHNLKPKGETFKTLISLCVKMRDFQGAYEMLEEAKNMGETPTASMYNAIIHGYFREKNRGGVQMVLNQMKNRGVEPDADTFSYLISNSDSEKDISKYWEELRQVGLQLTRSVCIGLIHAYCELGHFHKAKQVVKDPDAPQRYIAEIKSALVSNLASHGEITEAIKIYEEIKQEEFQPESKAVVCLIEHIKTEGELERMTELLKKLKDSIHWCDACCRVILYCVQHNYINDAIGLFKELRAKDEASAYMGVDQIFCHVRNMESVKVETCMQLLHALKEELGFQVSRTSLDFLLSMCVKARDSKAAMIVWKEYESAGLPYNVLTKLRMHQALMASGKFKAAKKMLKEIPQNDVHVGLMIRSCKQAFHP